MTTAHDFTLKTINGADKPLSDYKGRVLLVVNVASECGYTPQYTGLQSLYDDYKDKGFTIVGVPCNQFGGQEPGSNKEIREFCSATFHVTFPMLEKTDVNGANRHPLYVQLAGKASPFPGNIEWNFTKFLVGRDGKILARFSSKVKPDAPELRAAIESALATKEPR